MPFSRYWWGQVFKITIIALALIFFVTALVASACAVRQWQFDRATYYLVTAVFIMLAAK